MKVWTWIMSLFLAVLILAANGQAAYAGGSDPPPPSGSCNPDSETIAERTADKNLAYRWAPLIIQDTAGTYYADFIGKINFDGNWTGNNNWENLDSYAIPPYIYYNVTETSTHWFIFYHTFHPRDWNNLFFGGCGPDPDCHENDTENLVIMVKKDGTTYGQFRAMITQAHGDFYQYALAGTGVSDGWDNLDNDPERGFTLFTDSSVGITDPRPAIYIESKGHGVCEWWDNNGPYCIHPDDMVGTSSNDGVMYYPNSTATPSEPPNPTGGNWFNYKSPYRLVSLWDDVWVLRSCMGNGKTHDKPMTYSGVAGNGISQIGGALDGDSHGDDGATTYWAQSDGDLPIVPGDWAFKPATTMRGMLTFSETVSTSYSYNPYLGIQ